MKILSIILLLKYMTDAEVVCPFNSHCFCEGTALHCTDQEFISLPENLPLSTTYLTLSNNEIATLPVGVFDGLQNLTQLILNYNEIVTLPVGLFDGLENLKVLDLSFNEMVTLPIDLFDGLEKLEELLLHNNPTECCALMDLIAFGKQLVEFTLTCNDFNDSVPVHQFNSSECPIDGNWGDWDDSHCSVTCGYGTLQRTRECNNPTPTHGGQPCVGDSLVEMPCNLMNCSDENSCENAMGICLPKTMKCGSQIRHKKCGSCHYKCCERE